MIHSLESNLESFKSLTFKPGLNILLADKSEDATDKFTRNRTGKTSLVQLLHFLLGGNSGKSIFANKKLKPWQFNLKMEIDGEIVEVSRSGQTPNTVEIVGKTGKWPIPPHLDSATNKSVLSNANWRLNLGNIWFDLSNTSSESTERFQPTFRSLFSYFARRQNDGGFQDEFQFSKMQQLWNQQVSICYLLGLNSDIPRQFEEYRTEERISQQFRKAARDGDLGNIIEKSSDIQTKLAVNLSHADQLKEQLKNFKVVPEYENLESEVNEITYGIKQLNSDNFYDADLLRNLSESIKSEEPPKLDNVEQIYADIGLVFTNFSLKRIEDVTQFHKTVLENRREHLKDEIDSIEKRISERKKIIEKDDHRRQQIMKLLTEGGALEEYTNLNEEAGRVEAEVELLRKRLEISEKLENSRVELDIKQANLAKALKNDIHECRTIILDAIRTFEGLSASLYEKAGNLKISDTKNGPHFEISIDGKMSKGISNMQIFCFDFMLMEITRKKGRGLDLLVHDSHLFDGVDERQIAKALQTGAKRAEEFGFQYIVTLNTDMLPKDGFDSKFNIEEYLMPVRLTDKHETGGLFGFRF